jgi:branched-chain amino acid transport system permease protein
MRDGGRGVQEAWARTVAWLSAIMVRGHGIFDSRVRPWLGRAASEVATARATLHRAIAPVAASVRQQVRSRLSHTAAWLRASPLQPVMARFDARFDGWRLSRQQPAAGRFRIEVATPLSRCVALAGAILVAVLVALPAFASRTLINDLIFMFTMLALAQYWNLLAGYAGLVSVGQQAFVGLGGYLLFALTIHAGIDPLAAIVQAGLIAAGLALPTALVVFRLRGAYFAIGTWVMAEVYRLVFAQFGQLGGGTGTSLPALVTNEVAGIEGVKAWFEVRTPAARDIITYWAALGLAAGTILIVYLVLRSRHGLALAAIRDSDVAAESVGVDNFRNKLRVYVVTAGGTGMVGALIYLQKARISPDAAFSILDWTAYVIFIVVIGGIGTIEGPIVGVLVFYLLQSNLAHFGTWYLILLGLFAILVMLFAPKGIWGYLSDRYGFELLPTRRRLIRRSEHDEFHVFEDDRAKRGGAGQ